MATMNIIVATPATRGTTVAAGTVTTTGGPEAEPAVGAGSRPQVVGRRVTRRDAADSAIGASGISEEIVTKLIVIAFAMLSTAAVAAALGDTAAGPVQTKAAFGTDVSDYGGTHYCPVKSRAESTG